MVPHFLCINALLNALMATFLYSANVLVVQGNAKPVLPSVIVLVVIMAPIFLTGIAYSHAQLSTSNSNPI